MLFRLIMLLNILGLAVGPDAREEDEHRPGAQGFGNVVQIFTGLGLLVLVVLIVLGVMVLTGSFEMEHFDPTK